MGGLTDLGCFVIELAVGTALLSLLMLLICIDQVNLGILLGNRFNDGACSSGGVVVQADENITESLVNVVVDEFRYVGCFAGGNGDHVAAVGLNIGSI